MSRQRLIDFNEIIFTPAPIAPVFIGENVHYEDVAFMKQVLEIPTVEAVPIEILQEVLQEIRQEIEEKYDGLDICEYYENYDYEEKDISEYHPIGNVNNILETIDRYIKEYAE